jgi:hypothetical protein
MAKQDLACPSDERTLSLKKKGEFWHIYNLEYIMLSEISQSQKPNLYIPLICSPSRSQIHRDRKEKVVVRRGGGNGELVFDEGRVSVLQYGKNSGGRWW